MPTTLCDDYPPQQVVSTGLLNYGSERPTKHVKNQAQCLQVRPSFDPQEVLDMHLARKGAGRKVRPPTTNGTGTDTVDQRLLFSVLAEYQRGNFAVRMPDDRTGLAGKICDALNATIERNERLVKELERLSTVVGK